MAFHLNRTDEISKNHIFDAIKRHGTFNLQNKNKNHVARTNELLALLDQYMDDLRKCTESETIHVRRSSSNPELLNLIKSASRPMNPFAQNAAAERRRRSIEKQMGSSRDKLLLAWVETCLLRISNESKDTDIEKHLRVAAKSCKLKIRTIQELLRYSALVSESSIERFDQLIEQSAEANSVPSVEEAYNTLTTI